MFQFVSKSCLQNCDPQAIFLSLFCPFLNEIPDEISNKTKKLKKFNRRCLPKDSTLTLFDFPRPPQNQKQVKRNYLTNFDSGGGGGASEIDTF